MESKVCTLQALLIAEMLLPNSVLGSNTCNFPAIFNFGDSNSDTGGFSAVFGQAPPPYGETFFHAPVGRYSDGRLIIDFIAESLGLPYLSAYLDSVGSNFSHGANFATYASTIRPQNESFYKGGYSPISLDVQRLEYSEFLTRSQLFRKKGVSGDVLPEKDYFSRALYTFDIGQNDLTAGLDLGLTIDQIKAQVPDMVVQFSNVIKQIYSEGGRSFWIHNTPPLGCFTYVIAALEASTPQVDSYGCLIPYNELSQQFNLKLHEAVEQLREDLPLAAITYVDIYSAKYSLIKQAKKLDFLADLIAESEFHNKTIERSAKLVKIFTDTMIQSQLRKVQVDDMIQSIQTGGFISGSDASEDEDANPDVAGPSGTLQTPTASPADSVDKFIDSFIDDNDEEPTPSSTAKAPGDVSPTEDVSAASKDISKD